MSAGRPVYFEIIEFIAADATPEKVAYFLETGMSRMSGRLIACRADS